MNLFVVCAFFLLVFCLCFFLVYIFRMTLLNAPISIIKRIWEAESPRSPITRAALCRSCYYRLYLSNTQTKPVHIRLVEFMPPNRILRIAQGSLYRRHTSDRNSRNVNIHWGTPNERGAIKLGLNWNPIEVIVKLEMLKEITWSRRIWRKTLVCCLMGIIQSARDNICISHMQW